MKRGIQGIVMAGVLAAALSACAGSRTQESTGEYVDDSVLTTKVKTALLNDKGVNGSTDISVQTFKGRVQLAGFAHSAEQRQRAESVARSVTGVRSVSNRIELR